MTTVFDRFADAAARWPDRTFLRLLSGTAAAYDLAPRDWTYRQAFAETAPLAAAFRAAGYGPGVRVGLWLQNRPDFLWHWLALNKLGAGIVPINPDLRRAELEYLVSHSGMAAAVAVPDGAALLSEAVPHLPVLAPGEAPPPVISRGLVDSGTECALLYTSGTTGRPKGCVLDNRYFLMCGDWYAGLAGEVDVRTDPPERMLTPLPLFHMNALACSVMATMTAGGSLAILDRFHPKTWWASVHEMEATIVHYLGIMPPLLLALPETEEERSHSVRWGFGAGIGPALHDQAERRFGFPFVEGWAMTETGAGGVIMATHGPRKTGTACFGRPRDGVEARVMRDDGTEAAPDEPGELRVRRAGPDPCAGFFREYLHDAAATEAAWAGGWLHTGDVVARDADGDLHFIDRKKNIVRRSGENISAAEVEAVMAAHPGIARIAVAPAPDDLRGEEVLALIVPHGTPDPAEITAWALDRMAYHKAPGWIAFVEALPLTATEKLQRGAIRALADEVLTNGHAHDLRHLKRRQ